MFEVFDFIHFLLVVVLQMADRVDLLLHFVGVLQLGGDQLLFQGLIQLRSQGELGLLAISLHRD